LPRKGRKIMTVDRRSLLKRAAALPLTGAVSRRAFAGDATLFHCHQQLHMDFGFMALLNYA
jgi:hypothetical protein